VGFLNFRFDGRIIIYLDCNMEAFAVISGSTDITTKKDLMDITNSAKERYGKYKKAHHEWIDNVEQSTYR
jgi:hypothetical protein